jgi:hypothetical protein
MTQLRLPHVPEHYEPAPIRLVGHDPVEYGGGYLFQHGTRYWVEYTPGAESYKEGAELDLYQVDIPDDVYKEFGWAKPDLNHRDRHRYPLDRLPYGQHARRIRLAVEVGRDPDPWVRLGVLEDIAAEHGWDNLDSSPYRLTAKALEEHWAHAEKTAVTLPPRNPWRPASVGAHRRPRSRP